MEDEGDDEKKKQQAGGQWFAAVNHSQEFSKVVDTSHKPVKVIGYYTCAAPNRYVALDSEWNRLGAFPDQPAAKKAIVDNYQRR